MEIGFSGTFAQLSSIPTLTEDVNENNEKPAIRIPLFNPSDMNSKDLQKLPEGRRKSVNFNAETPKNSSFRKGGFEEKLLMQRVVQEISFSRNTNLYSYHIT